MLAPPPQLERTTDIDVRQQATAQSLSLNMEGYLTSFASCPSMRTIQRGLPRWEGEVA